MRVFVSYQTHDRAVVERLAQALLRARPDLDVFIAPWALSAGAYWLPRLAEELARTDAMLFVVGQRIGPWQELEYYEAQRLFRQAGRQGKPVIVPVLMVEHAPGLPFFDLLHHLVAADPIAPDAVAAILGALTGAQPQNSPPPWQRFNPFKGLAAMTSEDAAFFFGREGPTVEVLEALNMSPHKVLALVGASGVGKSSVAQAGVLAALKSRLWPNGSDREWPSGLTDSNSWLQLTMKPGEAPLKELAVRFLRLFVVETYKQDEEANGWAHRFLQGATMRDLLSTARRELDARAGAAPRRFILYIDQGEELYRAPAAQAQCFSRLIAEAAAEPDLHVLLSLRADYYGHLQGDLPLFGATRRIDVPPLSVQSLELVIRRPVERLGGRFDMPEMPERIAAATANETGALPLLSYLMSDLWSAMQARGDGVLRWADRAELIDVAAPLRERAERYRALHPQQDDALRRLFCLRLAYVPRSGEPVRRRARKSECDTAEWDIAQALATADWRLLTLDTDDENQEATAEVLHEQLLRRWPTLTRWLDERRAFLVWKGDFEPERREWEKLKGHERAAAVLTGRRLTSAQSWLKMHPADLGESDRHFIEASTAADVQHREQALQTQQRLHDIQLQAERDRALGAQKIARRTLVGVGGIVAAGGLGGAALLHAYRSEKAAQAERDAAAALAGEMKDWRDFREAMGGADPAPPDAAAVRTEELHRTAYVPSAQELLAAKPSWGVTAVAAQGTRFIGRGVLLAVVGTDVDVDHPAFRGVTFIRRDFTGESADSAPDLSHGTHTLGSILGRPVGGERFGVAPGVTEVLIAKVLGSGGHGTREMVLAGLQWAASYKRGLVDVICIALGEDVPQRLIREMADGADEEQQRAQLAHGLRDYRQQLRVYERLSLFTASFGKGSVIVAAAGNSSSARNRAPMSSPLSVAQGVVSVGAVEQAGALFKVPYYSDALPTLCAPGHDVRSAMPGPKIAQMSGTSMACAHAAGVAAHWWEHLRSQSGAEVTSRMVTASMRKAARADLFAPEVKDAERGAGLAQVPSNA